MLNTLSIKNYVLIKELEIDFHKGFSVITGETGAGKSIILGALNLILGHRADSSALLNSEQKCIVEGIFQIENYGLSDQFKRHQLDYEPQAILRREIYASGKSRAFINDTPVTLTVLKEIAGQLIDIHSQHQNLLLEQGDFQLSVIDGFAQTKSELEAYSISFKRYKALKKELKHTIEASEKALADLDYFQFQYNQLDQANLQEDEQQELEEEFKMQSHSEDIKSALTLTDQLLSSGEQNALSALHEIRAALAGVSKYHGLSGDLEERIKSVIIELKDVASEAELAANDIDFDPQRLDYINQRLNTIYELEQKHHVGSVAELIALQEDLDNKISNIQGFDENIAKLEQNIKLELAQLTELANIITSKRKDAIPVIESKTILLLSKLGMPNAAFSCKIEPLQEFSPKGNDNVSLLFSANKGGTLSALSKVASGGEKSRLMLVIKSLLSQQKQLPTILFDEIDTGISGAIAVQMGEIMRQMGSDMQVMSISHLPQVAAKGMHHYKVVKTEGEETTHTHIEKLNEHERLEELAKMLGSGSISDATMKNAQELMFLSNSSN